MQGGCEKFSNQNLLEISWEHMTEVLAPVQEWVINPTFPWDNYMGKKVKPITFLLMICTSIMQ